MENENKKILDENQQLSDDEIEEVSGGLAINTTLQSKDSPLSSLPGKKIG